MIESRYDIPPGCICLGDGLLGMKCEAPAHAKLKVEPERAYWVRLTEVQVAEQEKRLGIAEEP